MPGTKTRKRELHLLYLDKRIPVSEIDSIIERVWRDIYELEYDITFGRFRGIHMEEGGVVHVTWENVFGVPFISSILPDQEHTRMGYCPQDLFEKENFDKQPKERG